MRLSVLSPFDPWKHELCTCPKKYSLNPYTGCAHRCAYCYATYIPNFYTVREKKDLPRKLEKDLTLLCETEKSPLISMSNSSDPYPPLERKRELTRKCLEIFKNFDARILIITKSDIVTRDVKLLSELKCAVAISVTGFSSSVFEPFAPKPERRIRALKILHEIGIPVILRLDPLIPWIDKKEWEEILEKCCFVDHVVTSTLKLREDSMRRILKISPKLKELINDLYIRKGERIRNSLYLPKSVRENMLRTVEEKCSELGITCAFCREGFEFKAKSCDGSHLIR